MKTDPYATPESLYHAQLGIESTSQLARPRADLAHPGKRYQGQAIDGIATLAIFAGSLFGVKYLSLEGDLEWGLMAPCR